MLVLPFRMNEKSKGGVLFGNETIDKQQVASQCGNVLAMGSECYKDKEDILQVHGARLVIGWSSRVMQDHE
jgi:co-chaperonin GroES (HSP10)